VGFGGGLALSGDTAAIGSSTTSGGRRVTVLLRDDAGTPNDPSDDTWPQQAEFSSASPQEGFAQSIALQGDRLAIGVTGSNGAAAAAGEVRIYERAGGSWSQTATLFASDAAADDWLGGALELDGERLLVAALGNDQQGSNSGKVYLFERAGAAWFEVAQFTDPMPKPGERFGYALAFDETDRVAIGAPLREQFNAANGDGIVSVFRRESVYTTICAGDGTAGNCPCGNAGGPGEGCRFASSLPYGGRLRAYGSNSLAAGELAFVADQVQPINSALLFGGTSVLGGGLGVPLGDGLRCVASPLRRFGLQNTGFFGIAYWGPSFGAGSPWSAGETWRYQVWFRTSPFSVCYTGTSTTNAVAITFVP
jgi:hypothetical protein